MAYRHKHHDDHTFGHKTLILLPSTIFSVQYILPRQTHNINLFWKIMKTALRKWQFFEGRQNTSLKKVLLFWKKIEYSSNFPQTQRTEERRQPWKLSNKSVDLFHFKNIALALILAHSLTHYLTDSPAHRLTHTHTYSYTQHTYTHTTYRNLILPMNLLQMIKNLHPVSPLYTKLQQYIILDIFT